MSDQLTVPPTDPIERSGRRTVLLQFVLAVALLAALGAAGGVIWNWVWTPAVGVVLDHQWIAQDEAGLRGQFSSTGWYVVVASAAGLIGGALVALFFDRVPLLTLLAVILGSAIATWLMLHVGAALGPADPRHLALTAKDNTELSAALAVSRRSPWIAFPAGALIGLTLVFFGLSARDRLRD